MIPNKSQRRPLIDPALLALKSRRVLIAIAALAVGVLVLLLPQLAAVHDELLVLVATLALALIGGYSIEDAALAARQRAELPPQAMNELVKDAFGSVVDELAAPEDPTR